MNQKRLICSSLLSTVLLMPLAAQAQAQEADIRFGSGLDYSSGDYGDPQDTEILYLPVIASYEQAPFKAKLTLSWLQIKGPGTVIGGGDGGVVIGDGSSEVTTESGVGDIWASLSYSVNAIPPELFFMDIVGKVKVPTADEDKGLGTGEVDYTLQVDLFKPVGKLTPMATIAYKVKGDSDLYELDNVFYVSAGADYRYSDVLNFGATLDYQEGSTPTSEDRKDLFGYIGYRLNDDWRLTMYAYKGLTDGSADLGGGFQISLSL